MEKQAIQYRITATLSQIRGGLEIAEIIPVGECRPRGSGRLRAPGCRAHRNTAITENSHFLRLRLHCAVADNQRPFHKQERYCH
jgi:hypothetical protein